MDQKGRIAERRTVIFGARIVVVLLIFVISTAAMIISFGDLTSYAGMDLRNRIVGARAILRGLNPYTVVWYPGTDLALADYWQRYPGISRVTANPATLLLYVPFAHLSHRIQQILWWALQWLALVSSIFILFRSFVQKELRLLFLFVAVLCFVGSWFWRLHLERGQYYIFVTFLICLDVAALRKSKQSTWIGIPFGIAVALRPINLVLIPLLWLMGERVGAKKALLTAAVIFALSLPVVGWSAWNSWLDTIRLNELAEVDPVFVQKHFGPALARPPAVIEGLNFSEFLAYKAVTSDILPFIEKDWAMPVSRLLAVGIAALASATMWCMARQRSHISRDAFLMLLVVAPVLIDFTRTTRYVYADVAFLPVFAVALSVAFGHKLFLAAILSTSVLFMPFFEIPIQIEFLRSLCFVGLVGSLLLYLLICKRDVPATH